MKSADKTVVDTAVLATIDEYTKEVNAPYGASEELKKKFCKCIDNGPIRQCQAYKDLKEAKKELDQIKIRHYEARQKTSDIIRDINKIESEKRAAQDLRDASLFVQLDKRYNQIWHELKESQDTLQTFQGQEETAEQVVLGLQRQVRAEFQKAKEEVEAELQAKLAEVDKVAGMLKYIYSQYSGVYENESYSPQMGIINKYRHQFRHLG